MPRDQITKFVGPDLVHMLRIKRFHNTAAMREFRRQRGDISITCYCSMCEYATKVLTSCNDITL